MNIMSVKEASDRWGVFERWVQKLCVEGRIPNVQKFGCSWMIPKDAVRPDDLRKNKEKENPDV